MTIRTMAEIDAERVDADCRFLGFNPEAGETTALAFRRAVAASPRVTSFRVEGDESAVIVGTTDDRGRLRLWRVDAETPIGASVDTSDCFPGWGPIGGLTRSGNFRCVAWTLATGSDYDSVGENAGESLAHTLDGAFSFPDGPPRDVYGNPSNPLWWLREHLADAAVAAVRDAFTDNDCEQSLGDAWAEAQAESGEGSDYLGDNFEWSAWAPVVLVVRPLGMDAEELRDLAEDVFPAAVESASASRTSRSGAAAPHLAPWSA